MNRSTFKITKMDCSSEEQLIRMKLSDLEQVEHLEFDIEKRILEVYHVNSVDPIIEAIDALALGGTYLNSEETGSFIPPTQDSAQKTLLYKVLAINLFCFVLEIITGFVGNSMGLVADSMDMLADSLVYALAILAVGSTALRKVKIARLSGYFQIVLSVLGLVEIVRRFLGFGEVPTFQMMIIISLIALLGNGYSLYLFQKSKSEDAHMKASMIFTSNDVIINIGVIVAGVIVFITNSKIPDLIIGICVFAIVANGALRILKLAK